MDPIAVALIVLAVLMLATAGIITAVKRGRVKKYLAEAEEAERTGDDKAVILRLKDAVNNANEDREMEASILSRLEAVYGRHKLQYDLTDFHKLTEQFYLLKKKSSNKAVRELTKVAELKKKFVGNLPEL
jgi:hypothetical protein